MKQLTASQYLKTHDEIGCDIYKCAFFVILQQNVSTIGRSVCFSESIFFFKRPRYDVTNHTLIKGPLYV